MRRVVYLSTATSLPSVATLDAILADSRGWNADHDVTGLLLYHDGSFLQCLEGPEAGVEATYQKIMTASQHAGMIRLMDERAEVRLFPDWSMAFERPADGTPADAFEGLRQAGAKVAGDSPEARELTILVGSFLRTFRGLKAA